MKKFFPVFFSFFLLAGCVHVSGDAEPPLTAAPPPSLAERLQNTVTAEQRKMMALLPDVIGGLTDENGVSDYEKNKKGAGYSRLYESDGKLLTVFIGNNNSFTIKDGATPEAAEAMQKFLDEFKTYQDTGLYRRMKIEDVAEKEMTVGGKTYAFLRTTVSFEVKGEKKVTYIALIPNEKLLSYIRIRLTYPASFRAVSLQNEALKAAMTAVAAVK